MAIERIKNSFDPLAFLAKVGTGKTISVYRRIRSSSLKEKSRYDFYLQKGGVKIVVLSDQARKRSSVF
jgi:hypothetical protein